MKHPIVDGGRNNQYAQFKKHFQQAECLGLVDVPLSDKENNWFLNKFVKAVI